MKYIVGFSLIVLIVSLLIGPMFLFSTIFTGLGVLNPVSKADLELTLDITSQGNQVNSYKLFSTSNIMKKNDTIDSIISDDMGFNNN